MFRPTSTLNLCLTEPVEISGWVHNTRDHGGLLFVDLRDYHGIIQCVLDAGNPAIESLSQVRLESVVTIRGNVRLRPAGTENPDLETGSYELVVLDWEMINPSAILPFDIAEEDNTLLSEEQRLRYRFLDLRRNRMKKIMILRSEVIKKIRQLMWWDGFQEITTPLLTASSPEGARDYLIPSRLHPGKFYALPQAPQIFKQILMASGIEKYFQIAPCFRDEAGRSDRSPGEFYQLDLEIAWATQEQVFELVESVLYEIFYIYGRYDGEINKLSWPKISYKDAIIAYGTDKPDLRAELKATDLSHLFESEGPPFIVNAVGKGEVVRGITIPDAAGLTGKFYKEIEKYAQGIGMPGLGYIKTGVNVAAGNVSPGPLAKFMSTTQISELEQVIGSDSEVMATFIFVGPEKDVLKWVADVRVELSKRVNMFEEECYKFCWIVDYPMFEEDEHGKIEFSHNPFSMPQGGMDSLINKNPLDVLAHQYDLVCNGVELSSGAIRNHKLDVLFKAFEIVGYEEEIVTEKFPSLVNAFRFGCPPHGGIAPGIERILMLLAGETNIRNVIPFPLNGSAQDLMMGAPSEPSIEQLRELKIKPIL